MDIELACLKIHGKISESYIFCIHDWVISAYDVSVDDNDDDDSDHNNDVGDGDQKVGDVDT